MRWPSPRTAVAALGAWAVCGLTAAAAQATVAELAFVSLREGDAHIFLRDSTGREHRLTQGRTVNLQPSLAADGRVAFVVLQDGRSSIFVADRPGDAPRRLSMEPLSQFAPSWSPDGRHLAYFVGDPGSATLAVRVMDMVSGAVLSIEAPGPSLGPARPEWSADGQVLMFLGANAQRRNQVWVMSRDGSGLREVSSKFAARGAQWASLAPDGRRVAWVADLRGRTPVVVTDLSTGESRDLMAHLDHAAAESPRWSPDGQWIAFASNAIGTAPGGPNEVCVMKADGSATSNLSRHAAEDFDPRWTPDGRHLVFASLRSGTSLLYRVPLDGGEAEPLARHASHDMDHITRPASAR